MGQIKQIVYERRKSWGRAGGYYALKIIKSPENVFIQCVFRADRWCLIRSPHPTPLPVRKGHKVTLVKLINLFVDF